MFTSLENIARRQMSWACWIIKPTKWKPTQSVEEAEEGDSDHIEDNDEKVDVDDIYVGMVFRDEIKLMMVITHTRWRKDFP